MPARPIGTICSLSGTSPLRLYSISPSSTITGLLSRIADFRRPLASAGVAGATTFRPGMWDSQRSEEHTSELQSRLHLVCRLLLEKKKKNGRTTDHRTA